MNFRSALVPGLFYTACSLAVNSYATEAGGSTYPPGAENFTCCAVPPPGWYGMVFGESYRADSLRDNNGEAIPVPGFKVQANTVVPRLIYVTQEPVAGGTLAIHALLPLVNLKVEAAGLSDSRTGVGDLLFGPALGWHHSANLHSLLTFNVSVPTGAFDSSRLANIGHNHWALLPAAGISYIDPTGINADVQAAYAINAKNKKTDYLSGQELTVDYSLGWGFGDGWVVGVGGYLYQQVTNDELAGTAIDGAKGSAFAIGPSMRYDSGKGWFATLKYQMESNVRNRAEGSAVWLKVVFPI